MDIIQECMQMTSYGGEAKSLALQAIRQAREGDFKQAEESLDKSSQALIKSHHAHANLLTRDAEEGDVQVSVFMLHAADHLSSAEVINLLAEEFIYLHKKGGKNYVQNSAYV